MPFLYQVSSPEEGVELLEAFIELCKAMEKGMVKMTNVDKIVIGPGFDYTGFRAPGSGFHQIVKRIQSKDNQRYLMSLLRNRDTIPVCEDTVPFCLDGKFSKLCATVMNDIVISLRSSPVLNPPFLPGTCGDVPQSICNLSLEDHIKVHKEKLGIRWYHANAEKHKTDRENRYGKGKVASPMDLDDNAAQELLNRAVEIDNQLYAKKDGKIYSFRRVAPCIYHGYINGQAPEAVQRELGKIQWD